MLKLLRTHTDASGDDLAVTNPSGRPPGEIVPIRHLLRQALHANVSWIALALALLIVVFGVMAPGNFLTASNFTNLGDDAAILLVVSVGQTFVIIQGGIDLSMSSVLVFASVIAGEFMLHAGGPNQGWLTIIAGLLLGLLVGAGWGVINGLIIAKAKVPALITTLGTFGAVLGLADVITGGVDVRSVPTLLSTDLGIDSLFSVPWLVIVAIAATLVCAGVLHLTAFGQHTFAIGSKLTAARRAGVKVDRHIIAVYAISGLLAGLAGDLSLAQFGTTSIAGDTNVLLGSVTAVILGGASLFGGSGTMLGTVLGVMIPVVLANGLASIFQCAGINRHGGGNGRVPR